MSTGVDRVRAQARLDPVTFAGFDAVTFDCWGTLLYDRDPQVAVARRLKLLMEAAGIGEDRARDLLDRAWHAHYESWVGGTQFGARGMAAFCARETGLGSDRCAALEAAFEDAATHGPVDALPGARDALKMLRDAGIRTALVCDTGFTPGRIVRDFLKRHGLLDYLEFLAFSNEVGVPKPSPKIFLAALEAIDTPPQHAVHVGDLRRTDVAGAHGVGMKAIQITGRFQVRGAEPSDVHSGPEPDAAISSYDELAAALSKLEVNLQG